MSELWLSEAANAFWQPARALNEPVDVETLAVLTLPLNVKRMQNLTSQRAYDWLHQHCYPVSNLDMPSRPIRACLVALGGQSNFIWLEENDPADEQKFSLAHEVAHFLLDYQLPRAAAVARLGQSVTEVLDGRREPSLTERLEGVLTGLHIGPYQHFMERLAGSIIRPHILEAENRADQLALELLAPAAEVLAELAATNLTRYQMRLDFVTQLLTARYGLPTSVAAVYANSLLDANGYGPGVRDWLFT